MTPDPYEQPLFYEGIPLKRLIAWLVDMGLTLMVCLLVLIFTLGLTWPILPFLFMVIGFLYRWATLASGSATWGMRLMAMELRQGNDRPLDASTAFLHTLGYSVSLAMVPVQAVSVVLMLTTERKQGLTDMVLGTVALNRRR